MSSKRHCEIFTDFQRSLAVAINMRHFTNHFNILRYTRTVKTFENGLNFDKTHDFLRQSVDSYNASDLFLNRTDLLYSQDTTLESAWGLELGAWNFMHAKCYDVIYIRNLQTFVEV